MEVTTCETYSKVGTGIKWNVAIPRENGKTETKDFLVNGALWKLSLVSKIAIAYGTQKYSASGFEQWTMYLNGDFKTAFPLTLYMRHEGKNIFLNAVIIYRPSTEIWSCTYSLFQDNYPNISVNAVLFILNFHSDNGNYTNSLGEHKASDSTACAEIHPCLESLSLDMSHLMDESADADVQLTCGDLTIRAHKLILSARSEVFRTMLRSDMVEGRKGVIEIVDMEPMFLEIFIRYVYTGTLPALTEDAVLSLYEAADKYKMDGLRKRTSRLLTTILSPENALRILVVADAHDDKDLKSRVLSYVVVENIPRKDENWLKFCNDYPKLVVEVFNCQLFSSSQ